MKYKFLPNYNDIKSMIDGPYNDPRHEVGYNEEKFEVEYSRFRQALVVLLASFCSSIGLSEKDIHVGNRTAPTRGVGLVLEETVAPHVVELLSLMHEFISVIWVEYCISVNIVLDEQGSFEDLYMGISSIGPVCLHAENEKWFKGVGILV